MPYIYFLVLLVFLVIYSLFITVQLYKFIKLELFFKKKLLKNIGPYNIDQLFIVLRVLSFKKLWFTSIRVVEEQKDVVRKEVHRYFNAVGFIYYNMQKYDLAKLYYLKSLNEKSDYLVALNNLAKVYKKKKTYFGVSK